MEQMYHKIVATRILGTDPEREGGGPRERYHAA
jgi:hypothetical protein